MPGAMKRITLLKLAAGYQVFLVVYMIKCNVGEPSVAGWAYIFGVVLLGFVLLILGIDALLIKYVRNNLAFWTAQAMLFLLLVWLYINEGLPGRL